MRDLERKFGRFAVSNLTLKLLICYAAGFVLYYFLPGLSAYLSLNPYRILHRMELWRLLTWILLPTRSDLLSFAIMAVLFYFPIGRMLERTWGDFKYTLYLFSGFFFTVIGAFLLYAVLSLHTGLLQGLLSGIGVAGTGPGAAEAAGYLIAGYFSTYYVTMSIFFAYAATYPDATVLFMFIIPVRMKWLGVLYGVYLLYELAVYGLLTRVVIIASLMNFVLFFLLDRRDTLSRYRPKEVKRRQDFRRGVHMTPPGQARHRCAVCGQTEIDNPSLEFRYCSKCRGNYEYCQEHLFTHVHK